MAATGRTPSAGATVLPGSPASPGSPGGGAAGAGRASVPGAAPGSATARWVSYFDAVEHAALDVLDRISNGHPPAFPDLPVPPGPLPLALVARRDEVVAVIHEVVGRAQHHRDAVAAELAALAPAARVPDSPQAASLGRTLDVVG